jgi:Protein of unknown function, DUF599
MSAGWQWLAAGLTIAAIAAYELWLAVGRRAGHEGVARAVHAALREQWFDAVSAQKGSEILAVQTLRNSLMSASMTASAAVLGLMGTISLAAPSLEAGLARGAAVPQFTPRLALELVLLALLFASLVASVLAVRFYNHASFIGGMPVESQARERWSPAGRRYVARAGLLYSWSLRNLILVAPAVAFILHPVAGPVTAVLTVFVLHAFDRAHVEGRA